MEILNKSYLESTKIKKGSVIGFLVIEPDNFKFKHETQEATETKKRKLSKTSKSWAKKKKTEGGFLNRYDFAYAARDAVNQAARVAPGIIKSATKDIDEIAKNRINQIVMKGGTEIERVLPNILCGVIEDVYQTTFRLLGKFVKQQFNKIKNKILR